MPVGSGTELGAVEQQIVASYKPFLLFFDFLIKGIYCFDINIFRGENTEVDLYVSLSKISKVHYSTINAFERMIYIE